MVGRSARCARTGICATNPPSSLASRMSGGGYDHASRMTQWHEGGILKFRGRPRKGPQYVPPDVAYAIFTMWASLALSAAFAIYEFWASNSVLDPLIRLGLLVAYGVIVMALADKKPWARYAAVMLTVLFYAALAFDADGLTTADLLHLLLKCPLDVFVISRLFNRTVTRWLQTP